MNKLTMSECSKKRLDETYLVVYAIKNEINIKKADYIEKIDGQEVLTVEYSMFRGDTYEEHYNNYNFFSYKFVN